MRVLLIESVPEDVVFLRDVLVEIGEGRYGANWVNMKVLEAGSWGHASAILLSEPGDIMLLSVDALDSQGIETFRRAQREVSDIPVVLLLGASEEQFGIRLVREGAQDFLMKKHVDCAPLAHAMRNAIERHRLLNASRAASTYDTLTGLLNRSGFLTCADRDCKVAQRLDRRLMVVVAEVTTTYDEQRRDLAILDAADHLRSLTGPADLVARIEDTRFGITIFDIESESVEAAWTRMYAALRQHRIHLGAAIFSSDHPATLDELLEQATNDLFPQALAQAQ
jgi:PleD family two-component response regulator